MILTAARTLPADGTAGALAGRVWRPDCEGPSVVAVRADGVFDVSRDFPTMVELCEMPNPGSIPMPVSRGCSSRMSERCEARTSS